MLPNAALAVILADNYLGLVDSGYELFPHPSMFKASGGILVVVVLVDCVAALVQLLVILTRSLCLGRCRKNPPLGVAGRTLSTPQSDLWDAYLDAENRGLRSERNDALERFLDSFAELSQTAQHDWAISLASQIVDDGLPTPVRMPLFRGVLLPALESATANRTPGAARWFAGFAQHIYKCSDLRPRLVDGTLTEHALLETAIDHDPEDDRSRRKLLDLLVSRLNYTLHELPSGVLFHHDGATVDQCREMLEELNDFSRHADLLGVADDYADLVADCRFHYNMYSEYLTDRRGASCYADYLSQVGDA